MSKNNINNIMRIESINIKLDNSDKKLIINPEKCTECQADIMFQLLHANVDSISNDNDNSKYGALSFKINFNPTIKLTLLANIKTVILIFEGEQLDLYDKSVAIKYNNGEIIKLSDFVYLVQMNYNHIVDEFNTNNYELYSTNSGKIKINKDTDGDTMLIIGG